MSRSVRRTPITGVTTASSEKRDKQDANRRYRRAERIALSQGDEILPDRRELGDPWTMSKDGKKWFGNSDSRVRLLRK